MPSNPLTATLRPLRVPLSLTLLTLSLAACTPAPPVPGNAAQPALIPQAIDPGSNSLVFEPFVEVTNGWGPVERNRSNGEQGANDGRPMNLNGRAYDRGFGTHAGSSMTFDLAGKCATFTSDVGVDDSVGNNGSVIFQVFADGAKIYDSGVMTGASGARQINVSVAGKRELRLVATDAGDGNTFDHANWASPMVHSCTTVAQPQPMDGGGMTQTIGVGIKNTAYPVPGDAIVVSPTGSDSNAGTLSAPFRTIRRALNVAYHRPGVTVVLRGGTYREAPGAFSTRLTLQPYPNEQVWIKGSVVVTGWASDGGAWRKDGYNPALCRTCTPASAVSPQFPNAGLPDMVFVDGQPLEQVSSRAGLRDGTFYVDVAARQLFIGTNPEGRVVESAAFETALSVVTSSAAGSVIRGLGFMHFASSGAQDYNPAAVMLDTSNLTFENNTVAHNAARGVMVYRSRDSIVRGNTFERNGHLGMAASGADRMKFEENVVRSNNTEHFEVFGGYADAAGVKFTASTGVQAKSNLFAGNNGPGLWFDISCTEAAITNNVFKGNSLHGLMVELSSRMVVASNVAAENRGSGLYISNSSGVKIYNNTLWKNATNMSVVDDSRVNTNAVEYGQGTTWITSDVTFANNISSESLASGPQIYVRDYNSTVLKPASSMLTVSDHNGYFRTSASVQPTLVEWWRDGAGHNRNIGSVTQFRSDAQREYNGVQREGSMDPYLRNPANGDFALAAGSPAQGSGTALPTDVATVLGVSAGVPMNQGALTWTTLQ